MAHAPRVVPAVGQHSEAWPQVQEQPGGHPDLLPAILTRRFPRSVLRLACMLRAKNLGRVSPDPDGWRLEWEIRDTYRTMKPTSAQHPK